MLRPGFPRLSHPGVAHAISSIAFIAQGYRGRARRFLHDLGGKADRSTATGASTQPRGPGAAWPLDCDEFLSLQWFRKRLEDLLGSLLKRNLIILHEPLENVDVNAAPDVKKRAVINSTFLPISQYLHVHVEVKV